MADLKLFYENQRLVFYIANKFCKIKSEMEDIQQCGMIGLFKASRTFNPKYGKFSSYAYACIKAEIFTYLKKFVKRSIAKNEYNDTIDYRASQTIDIKDYIPNLSDKELDILQMKLEGFTCIDISNKYGCTKQNIHQVLSRLRKQCKHLQKS